MSMTTIAYAELLKLLIPAIERIDERCPSCVDAFCSDVNEILEAMRIHLRLKSDTDDDSSFPVVGVEEAK